MSRATNVENADYLGLSELRMTNKIVKKSGSPSFPATGVLVWSEPTADYLGHIADFHIVGRIEETGLATSLAHRRKLGLVRVRQFQPPLADDFNLRRFEVNEQMRRDIHLFQSP